MKDHPSNETRICEMHQIQNCIDCFGPIASSKEPICAVCDRAFTDHVSVISHDFVHQKTEVRPSKTVAQRLREAANGCAGFDSEARLMCEAATELEEMPAEVRRLAKVWRNDALEAAAKIIDRYGLDGYGAAYDIRFLKSKDAPTVETSENERTLRRLLAFAYSGSYLYGDDGELQDSRLPVIDYVRDSVQELERKIHERGMKQLLEAGVIRPLEPACHHDWQVINASDQIYVCRLCARHGTSEFGRLQNFND